MPFATWSGIALRGAGFALCCGGGCDRPPPQPLDKVSFGTNWVAEAEHGGFYQALADGTYRKYGLDVTIVPGGPNANNRMLLLAGKIDFFMSANTLQGFDAVDQQRADGRGRRDVPEGPAGPHRPSGSRASTNSRISRR